MAKNNDDPRQKKRRNVTPEQKWIRNFLEFYGTDNITRFCREDLNGVSLIRVVEALMHGDHIGSEKCDGPGTVCRFEHDSEDDRVTVTVTVWFAAGTMELEILGASTREMIGEPDAA